MWTLLLALLLLPTALLAIPLSLSFQARWPHSSQSRVTLRWGFGLITLQLPAPQGSAAEAKEVKRGREAKGGGKKGNPLALFRHKPSRRRLIRYLRDCWRALYKRDLRLRLRIGLDDPADTGQLWAMMGPLAALLANSRGASLAIEPDFHEETFEFDGSGRLEFVPLQLIYLTLALLLSPPLWQGIRQMRKTP